MQRCQPHHQWVLGKLSLEGGHFLPLRLVFSNVAYYIQKQPPGSWLYKQIPGPHPQRRCLEAG